MTSERVHLLAREFCYQTEADRNRYAPCEDCIAKAESYLTEVPDTGSSTGSCPVCGALWPCPEHPNGGMG